MDDLNPPFLHGGARCLAFVGLAPAPRGKLDAIPLSSGARTGRRLAKLLGVKHVHDVACTVNVLPRHDSPRDGWRGRGYGAFVKRLLDEERVQRAVVLGNDAARLMGLVHEKTVFVGAQGTATVVEHWFEWRVDQSSGLYYAVAPHPSGRNLWWNDARNAERAADFFGALGRPR